MSLFGWMVTFFALFMAGVSIFTFIQIERNRYHRDHQNGSS
jgi:hypothetical protein|tara:strand:+ start:974 stop:1096 length:123 start_codon:yes stop_codon:yes gene_type:complete